MGERNSQNNNFSQQINEDLQCDDSSYINDCMAQLQNMGQKDPIYQEDSDIENIYEYNRPARAVGIVSQQSQEFANPLKQPVLVQANYSAPNSLNDLGIVPHSEPGSSQALSQDNLGQPNSSKPPSSKKKLTAKLDTSQLQKKPRKEKVEKVVNPNEESKINDESVNNNPNSKKQYLKMQRIEVDEQRKSEQVQLMVEDTEIFFPFEPYPQQLEYMRSVIRALNAKQNALLESPTGTGKTLCLLCASLGWLRRKRLQQLMDAERHPVRIIYSSRTHSQLQQVVKELKTTIYKPRMLVLASRDQYCLKQEFEMLSGGIKTAACQKAIKGDDPKIQCKFYKGHLEEDQQDFMHELQDIEDLKQSGTCKKFCPYFYGRRYKDAVDLLFLPYNYLLDNSGQIPFQFDLNNAIVIFDEAHNVHKISEDGSSIGLKNLHLDAVEKELAILREILANYSNPQEARAAESGKKKPRAQKNSENSGGQQGFKSSMLICYQILSVTRSLKGWMTKEIQIKRQSTTQINEGRAIFRIIQDKGQPTPETDKTLAHVSINQQSKEAQEKAPEPPLNPFLEGLSPQNLDKFIEYLNRVVEDLSSTKNFGLDQLLVFSKLIRRLWLNDLTAKINKEKTWVENPVNNYKLLTTINYEKQEYEIFLQCLDASMSFHKLLEKLPYNMLFTSGTLSPMDSWSAELKMPFQVRLSNSHVINKEESLLAGILRAGPLGNELSFTYENRKNNSLLDDLGISIMNLVRHIPNGVLIIFNSSSALEVCRKRWQVSEKRILEDLGKLKHLVYEPIHSSDLNFTLDTYTRQARTPKGAILFAVCRGKISEGIDFSDELARAVFIVGVPYPPAKDPRVTNKRDHLDKIWNDRNITGDKLSGQQWYLQQAIRAMNQAIGRIIRHREDWGAVFLCDSRFNNVDVKGQISDWVKQGDGLKQFETFPTAIMATIKFFNSKSKSGSTGNMQKQQLAVTQAASSMANDITHMGQDFRQKKFMQSSGNPQSGPFRVKSPIGHQALSTSELMDSLSRKRLNNQKVNAPFQPVGLKQRKMTEFRSPTPQRGNYNTEANSSFNSYNTSFHNNNISTGISRDQSERHSTYDSDENNSQDRHEQQQQQLSSLNSKPVEQRNGMIKLSSIYSQKNETSSQNQIKPLEKPAGIPVSAKLSNMVSPMIKMFIEKNNAVHAAMAQKEEQEKLKEREQQFRPSMNDRVQTNPKSTYAQQQQNSYNSVPVTPPVPDRSQSMGQAHQQYNQHSQQQAFNSHDASTRYQQNPNRSYDRDFGYQKQQQQQQQQQQQPQKQEYMNRSNSQNSYPRNDTQQLQYQQPNMRQNPIVNFNENDDLPFQSTPQSNFYNNPMRNNNLNDYQQFQLERQQQMQQQLQQQAWNPNQSNRYQFDNYNNNSNSNGFFNNSNSNSFNDSFNQQGMYNQNQFQQQHNPYQQQHQYNSFSQCEEPLDEMSYRKQQIPPAQRTLGVNKQQSSTLKRLTESINTEYPVEEKKSIKSSEKCFICKQIPQNRCINNSCEHIGCDKCFRFRHRQYKKCTCGEAFSLKDLRPI